MPQQARDPYQVLGVDPGATDTDVRAAYRRLVLKHHPDHNGGSAESARRFEEVQEAYARVRELRAAGAPPRAQTPPSGTGTGTPRRGPPPTPTSTPGWRSWRASCATLTPRASGPGAPRRRPPPRRRSPSARPTRSSATSRPTTASRRSSMTPAPSWRSSSAICARSTATARSRAPARRRGSACRSPRPSPAARGSCRGWIENPAGLAVGAMGALGDREVLHVQLSGDAGVLVLGKHA